jgi:hypothetical protein
MKSSGRQRITSAERPVKVPAERHYQRSSFATTPRQSVSHSDNYVFPERAYRIYIFPLRGLGAVGTRLVPLKFFVPLVLILLTWLFKFDS